MVQNQIHVLSVPIDVVTMTEAVDRVLSFVGQPKLHMVATANAEMIMMAQDNQRLLEVLQQADLVVPDGAGALWAAEQQGQRFPERVTGCDLLQQLLKAAKAHNIKISFFNNQTHTKPLLTSDSSNKIRLHCINVYGAIQST